ncbi:4a-hydroxytetrahydrobiopterin dehydratase [Streptomyces sp. SID3343]|uniref:4a-hydroxytetrahydrobiopterin dehydratase n=1 Tax=Streptomyces sp. SID3343 TaxID=2690260 RepID=UPI0013686659|nr:4a-hydroxytetrahydrobiopterin dehydratase [Streptomyces sp. SID3343]MYW00640.1 4a-hydroxytetrahydrobiopterin dehydratase [Streptomyces sp. SID3343]
MATQPLTPAELDRALATLSDWRVADGALTATYETARPAVGGFYAAVAEAEDAADHHARVTILYGTLSFALNTHDAGGAITAKDVETAHRITELASEHGATARH